MLAIPLSVLEQEGSLEIQAAIPPDDPRWEGTGLRFITPLSVMGQAHWIQSGEVLARMRLQGTLSQECRRCLEPVEVPVDEEVDLLFSPVDELNEDDEARPLPVGQADLDLGDPVREEVILSQSPYALCRPDCKGLCPRCGTNLNEEQCQCSQEESDPRWDALRALREE